MLVSLKPDISPDVAIDCPPSILFLSMYLYKTSQFCFTLLVLKMFLTCESLINLIACKDTQKKFILELQYTQQVDRFADGMQLCSNHRLIDGMELSSNCRFGYSRVMLEHEKA